MPPIPTSRLFSLSFKKTSAATTASNLAVNHEQRIPFKTVLLLFLGTVLIFGVAVVGWKTGAFLRRFTAGRVLNTTAATIGERGGDRSGNVGTRYARTWYGWVSVGRLEARRARWRVRRERAARALGWRARSTGADYRWVWWDPDGELLDKRRRTREEEGGLARWLVPRWWWSYRFRGANAVWGFGPECFEDRGKEKEKGKEKDKGTGTVIGSDSRHDWQHPMPAACDSLRSAFGLSSRGAVSNVSSVYSRDTNGGLMSLSAAHLPGRGERRRKYRDPTWMTSMFDRDASAYTLRIDNEGRPVVIRITSPSAMLSKNENRSRPMLPTDGLGNHEEHTERTIGADGASTLDVSASLSNVHHAATGSSPKPSPSPGPQDDAQLDSVQHNVPLPSREKEEASPPPYGDWSGGPVVESFGGMHFGVDAAAGPPWHLPGLPQGAIAGPQSFGGRFDGAESPRGSDNSARALSPVLLTSISRLASPGTNEKDCPCPDIFNPKRGDICVVPESTGERRPLSLAPGPRRYGDGRVLSDTTALSAVGAAAFPVFSRQHRQHQQYQRRQRQHWRRPTAYEAPLTHALDRRLTWLAHELEPVRRPVPLPLTVNHWLNSATWGANDSNSRIPSSERRVLADPRFSRFGRGAGEGSGLGGKGREEEREEEVEGLMVEIEKGAEYEKGAGLGDGQQEEKCHHHKRREKRGKRQKHHLHNHRRCRRLDSWRHAINWARYNEGLELFNIPAAITGCNSDSADDSDDNGSFDSRPGSGSAAPSLDADADLGNIREHEQTQEQEQVHGGEEDQDQDQDQDQDEADRPPDGMLDTASWMVRRPPSGTAAWWLPFPNGAGGGRRGENRAQGQRQGGQRQGHQRQQQGRKRQLGGGRSKRSGQAVAARPPVYYEGAHGWFETLDGWRRVRRGYIARNVVMEGSGALRRRRAAAAAAGVGVAWKKKSKSGKFKMGNGGLGDGGSRCDEWKTKLRLARLGSWPALLVTRTKRQKQARTGIWHGVGMVRAKRPPAPSLEAWMQEKAGDLAQGESGNELESEKKGVLVGG